MRNNGKPVAERIVRCAIYTRKSTEEGLEQDYNSLDAQRDSAENFIKSQAHEGWQCLPNRYDDGGFSGGDMERPALRRLLADITAGRIDCVVVYKVDRLSRSLLDFAKMMETFEKHHVSFVSVTQHFNTSTSMGRLILNVLLSFAQFEREMISERTRDKIAAARRKGKWVGGMPILGYNVENSKLVVNEEEAQQVRAIFELYLEHESLKTTVQILNRRHWRTKRWVTKRNRIRGGTTFNKKHLHDLLTNVAYIGKVRYKREVHPGEHRAIVKEDVFLRVQAMLKRNQQTCGARLRNKYGALLRGLLRCAACGCAMVHSFVSKRNRRYRYYVCRKAQQEDWAGCPAPSLQAPEIERFVAQQLKRIAASRDIFQATLERSRQQSQMEIENLQRQLKDLQVQLKKDDAELQILACDAGETAESLRGEILERMRVTEQQVTQIKDEIIQAQAAMPTPDDVAAALDDFDRLWDTFTPREQARIIELLVEQVVYDGVNGKVSITFRPAGVKKLADQPARGREAVA